VNPPVPAALAAAATAAAATAKREAVVALVRMMLERHPDQFRNGLRCLLGSGREAGLT
jgi:hypothetical protein